jgi:hypothetical protein
VCKKVVAVYSCEDKLVAYKCKRCGLFFSVDDKKWLIEHGAKIDEREKAWKSYF